MNKQLQRELDFLRKQEQEREIAAINADLDRKAEVFARERVEAARAVELMARGVPSPDEVYVHKGPDGQTRLFGDHEVESSRTDGERLAVRTLALELAKRAVVETPVDVQALLDACRMTGDGRVGSLRRGLSQHMGGKNSPNLVRVPFLKDGTVDFGALSGTALSVGVQWLKFGEHFLPAPLYVEGCVKVVRLTHLSDAGEVDCGLYFDLQPFAVTMDTAVKTLPASPGVDDFAWAVVDIAASAKLSLETLWDKHVLGHHAGWSISAQLLPRVDIADDELVITPEMAEFIAQQEDIPVERITGSVYEGDFTGYPLVNAACRPRLRIRVLDERGLMPHFGLSPLVTDLMGRDNDGDAPTLSSAGLTAADEIKCLLARKDNNE